MNKAKQISSKIVIPIRWTKPFVGWHKLNTNGASLNLGKAGGEGIIRDSQGNWVKGFSRSIGYTTSVMSELWALRDGLNLAIQLGIHQFDVELHAKVIVDLLNGVDSPNRAYSPLLYDCRSLLARLTQARVVYTFREVNKCANFLAKRGCSIREDFVIFDVSPSVELDQLLDLDINGLYYYRLVAVAMASVAN